LPSNTAIYLVIIILMATEMRKNQIYCCVWQQHNWNKNKQIYFCVWQQHNWNKNNQIYFCVWQQHNWNKNNQIYFCVWQQHNWNKNNKMYLVCVEATDNSLYTLRSKENFNENIRRSWIRVLTMLSGWFVIFLLIKKGATVNT